MLDSVIAKMGAILFIVLSFICCALALEMMTKWYLVHNQAQFIAKSMGKHGGYTTIADQSLKEFVQDINASRSDISVEVSNTNPVPWGRVVKSKITYTYNFKIGTFMPGFKVPLTSEGRSVSTYGLSTVN